MPNRSLEIAIRGSRQYSQSREERRIDIYAAAAGDGQIPGVPLLDGPGRKADDLDPVVDAALLARADDPKRLVVALLGHLEEHDDGRARRVDVGPADVRVLEHGPARARAAQAPPRRAGARCGRGQRVHERLRVLRDLVREELGEAPQRRAERGRRAGGTDERARQRASDVAADAYLSGSASVTAVAALSFFALRALAAAAARSRAFLRLLRAAVAFLRSARRLRTRSRVARTRSPPVGSRIRWLRRRAAAKVGGRRGAALRGAGGRVATSCACTYRFAWSTHDDMSQRFCRPKGDY